MLNLTRFPTQSIKIGDEIIVTILGINGNQVRLGINAPKEIAVLREEVIERMGRPAVDLSVEKSESNAGDAHQASHAEPEAQSDPPARKQPKIRYKRRLRNYLHTEN